MSIICNNTTGLQVPENFYNNNNQITGSEIGDANKIVGSGLYSNILEAGSLNLPTNNDYLIQNVINPTDGSIVQFATPKNAGSGSLNYRTFDGLNWSGWVQLATIDDLNLDHKYTKIDGSNISPSTWINLKSGDSQKWEGQTFADIVSTADPVYLMAYDLNSGKWQKANKNILKAWLDIAPPNLNGFLYNPQYDAVNHIFTMDVVGGAQFSIDFDLERLILNIDLVGNDLIFYFEDGSIKTIPLNTLLVGVVKEVNGKTPDSAGRVVLQIGDIPNLSSELNNKANVRLNNIAANLSAAEQLDINSKIGAQNKLTAGTNIQIDTNTNTISATDTIVTFTPSSTIALLKTGNNYEFSLTTAVQNDILVGTWAYSWGDHRQAGYLKQVDLNGYAAETWVSSNFSQLGHTHPIGEVNGLQNALDLRAINMENAIGIGFSNGNFNDAPYFYHDTGGYRFLATQEWVGNNFANTDGSNITNAQQWRTNLGITSNVLNPTLQQVTNNGNSTFNRVFLRGGATLNGDFFLNDNTQPLGIYFSPTSAGGLYIGKHSNGVWTGTIGEIRYDGVLHLENSISTSLHGTSADWNQVYNDALRNHLGHPTISGYQAWERGFAWINGSVTGLGQFPNWTGCLLAFGNSDHKSQLLVNKNQMFFRTNYGATDDDTFKEVITDQNISNYVNNIVGGNYALTNGSNTIGGSWKIDMVLSDNLFNSVGNSQVFNATQAGAVFWGNPNVNNQYFEVNSPNGLQIYTPTQGYGEIWNKHNMEHYHWYGIGTDLIDVYNTSNQNKGGFYALDNILYPLPQMPYNYGNIFVGGEHAQILFDGYSDRVTIRKKQHFQTTYSLFDIYHSGNFDPNNYALLSNVYTQSQVNNLLINYVSKAGDNMQGDLGLHNNSKLKLAGTADQTHYIWRNPVSDFDEVDFSTGFNVKHYLTGDIATFTDGWILFNRNLIVPNATANNHAVNLGQLNSAISGLGAGIWSGFNRVMQRIDATQQPVIDPVGFYTTIVHTSLQPTTGIYINDHDTDGARLVLRGNGGGGVSEFQFNYFDDTDQQIGIVYIESRARSFVWDDNFKCWRDEI